MKQQNTDSPAWRPEYWTTYLVPLWNRVCNCYHGLHDDERKKQYLRQQLGEHDKVYAARVETVAFENRLSPSVKAHAGLLSDFRLNEDTPTRPDDSMSKAIQDCQNDVDGQGNSLESVLLDWDIDALLYNASLALVDVPVAETEEEMRQPRQPRIVRIALKDVFSPKVAVIDGHLEIAQIAVQKAVSVDEGLFGVTMRDRFWVYRLVPTDPALDLRNDDGSQQRYQATFELWEESVDENNKTINGEYIQIETAKVLRDIAGRPLNRIPIIWYAPYGDPLLFYGVDDIWNRGGTPEYMSLVDLNFEYFNKHSELNTAESRSNFVILVKRYPGAAPTTESDLTTGGRIIVLEGGAELDMLEPAGSAIASTREGQRDRLVRMDAIAQSFLTGGDVARTATEAVIESSQSRLGLRNIARRKESTVQQIFYWWERFTNPQYREGDPVGGITVSEAVLTMPASAQELEFWSGEFLNGNLTRAEYRAKLRELGAYTKEMASAAAEEVAAAGPALGLNNNALMGAANGNGIQ